MLSLRSLINSAKMTVGSITCRPKLMPSAVTVRPKLAASVRTILFVDAQVGQIVPAMTLSGDVVYDVWPVMRKFLVVDDVTATFPASSTMGVFNSGFYNGSYMISESFYCSALDRTTIKVNEKVLVAPFDMLNLMCLDFELFRIWKPARYDALGDLAAGGDYFDSMIACEIKNSAG